LGGDGGDGGDDEPVDRLPLAALLIGDGNYDRARQVLAAVDTDAEDFDAPRYHTLSGLVALNLEEYPRAVVEFEQAIEAGQDAPVVYLYLAQAHFGDEDYAATLSALDQAGEDATRIPSVFLIRSQALWSLERFDEAWAVLNQGRTQFPDRVSDFARRQVFLLVEQGLYQAALSLAQDLLGQSSGDVSDALAIGNALRRPRCWKRRCSPRQKMPPWPSCSRKAIWCKTCRWPPPRCSDRARITTPTC
jgi:tetratricopeptide (TPR) repeat protein